MQSSTARQEESNRFPRFPELYTIFPFPLSGLYSPGLCSFPMSHSVSTERGLFGMETHTESSLLVGLRARDEHAYEQFV